MLGLIALSLIARPAPAQQQAAPCDRLDGFHRLDFWLGEWEVRSGAALVGTSTIEKILNGCAIMEHWRGVGGGEGRSLFYHDHVSSTWKQVWVTQNATAPGGLKEKTLRAIRPDGSLRFEGSVALPDGRSYLDRTTLSPLRGDSVRQVIETSADGGATWQTRFDAIYSRRSPGAPGEGWTTLASFRRARATVERALAALGGAEAIARAGGLALDGAGSVDLGTLLQGRRPFEGDRYPIEERLAIVPDAGRLVHEDRTPINPDASNWRRTDHRRAGTYRIDLEARRASWSRPASRRTIERTIPHYLLAEVLANPASLRHLGTVRVANDAYEAVGWHAPDRGPVTLLFDGRDGVLRAVESLADLPVYGDARVRWTFLDYAPVPGLGPFPQGYAIHIDSALLREIRWTRRVAAPTGGVLDAPEGIELPPPVPFSVAERGGGADGAGGAGSARRGGAGGSGGSVGQSGTGGVSAAGGSAGQGSGAAERPDLEIRDLAPGVHLLVNLRTGFHVLFVDFGEYVVAVDAPAGWWELQELPARNWAGDASPALGERYVEGIRSRLGDKPIRYVVLTHHHGDHAGGVRAFVERGATVVAAELTRPVVERTLAGRLMLAGRDSSRARAMRFEAVSGRRLIRDGAMEMHVIDVGVNPHSDGMLAVWLPAPRILYVSDLFEPWGPTASPSPDRLPVMQWFVRWLDASGLEPERIYAIHRAGLVSESNLDEIRRGLRPPRQGR